MKKRLLITSIVMMLVVAVALSTATYAWFTSNNSVTANTVHMTAAVSNLESISIAWLNSEEKAGTLTAADGDALQPMVPTTNLTGTTAATVAFTGASIGLDGKFDANGASQTPYTWKSSGETPVTAFYINNDSTTTYLDIKVTVANISYYNATPNAEIQPLVADTLLQKGQIYYKKTVSGQTVTWTRLIESETENYAENKYIPDSTKATGSEGSFVVYGTKGIEDYVRVAVFATTEYTSTATKPDSVDPANYSYKGILAKTGIEDPIGYGAITSGMNPNVLTTTAQEHPALTAATNDPTTGGVTVVTNLSPLARVYVIVKVWNGNTN